MLSEFYKHAVAAGGSVTLRGKDNTSVLIPRTVMTYFTDLNLEQDLIIPYNLDALEFIRESLESLIDLEQPFQSTKLAAVIPCFDHLKVNDKFIKTVVARCSEDRRLSEMILVAVATTPCQTIERIIAAADEVLPDKSIVTAMMWQTLVQVLEILDSLTPKPREECEYVVDKFLTSVRGRQLLSDVKRCDYLAKYQLSPEKVFRRVLTLETISEQDKLEFFKSLGWLVNRETMPRDLLNKIPLNCQSFHEVERTVKFYSNDTPLEIKVSNLTDRDYSFEMVCPEPVETVVTIRLIGLDGEEIPVLSGAQESGSHPGAYMFRFGKSEPRVVCKVKGYVRFVVIH